MMRLLIITHHGYLPNLVDHLDLIPQPVMFTFGPGAHSLVWDFSPSGGRGRLVGELVNCFVLLSI
jgi:hypothetical protein